MINTQFTRNSWYLEIAYFMQMTAFEREIKGAGKENRTQYLGIFHHVDIIIS